MYYSYEENAYLPNDEYVLVSFKALVLVELTWICLIY